MILVYRMPLLPTASSMARNIIRRPRTLGRAKYLRRRKRISRGIRIKQPVQFFKRTQMYTNWIVNNSTFNQLKSYTFLLNELPNHTEFTNLYDQYQIKGAQVTLIPKFNVNTIVDIVPPTWSTLDYDGSFPTTDTQMLQYQNLHTVRGQRNHKRYLKPALLQQAYQGLTTAYAPKKNVWIDCSNDAVPHYGVTFMLPPIGATEPFAYDLKVVYYLAFKNVR